MILFFTFKENTWRSDCRQLLAFPNQRIHHETFWVLYQELVIENVLKTVCGIVLVLLWFRMSSMTQIKYLNINQVKREHIPINFLPFSSRVSLDADCIFAWLIFFVSSYVSQFVVEWIPAIMYDPEITLSPRYHEHYCSCWWIIRCTFYICGVWFRLIL